MTVSKGIGRGKSPKKTEDKLKLMDCEKIKELASLNLSIEKIFHCLGVARTFYFDHRDEHPEWEQAIKDGRALGVQKVAEALKKTAEKGNVTAQIFYLKNADPEQWNKEQTNVNANVNIQSVEDLSDSDLDSQIKKLEKLEAKEKTENE